MAVVTSANVVEQCLRRWQRNPLLSMADLHREMVKQGYPRSYETLARLLKEVRPDAPTSENSDMLSALLAATSVRAEAEAAALAAAKAQSDLIRHAVADGLSMLAIAKVTGLTTPRLYQIRDNRRR